MRTFQPGEIVHNAIGHAFEVVSGGPWQYVVQPLTPGAAGALRPLGGPCRMGRSEIRES